MMVALSSIVVSLIVDSSQQGNQPLTWKSEKVKVVRNRNSHWKVRGNRNQLPAVEPTVR